MMPLKTWTRVCVKMDLDLDLDVDLGLGSAIRADPGDDHPKGRGARSCCHLSQLVSDDRRRRTCCVISAACMDGAHAKQRVTAEAVYADKQEAAAKRQGVQHPWCSCIRQERAGDVNTCSVQWHCAQGCAGRGRPSDEIELSVGPGVSGASRDGRAFVGKVALGEQYRGEAVSNRGAGSVVHVADVAHASKKCHPLCDG